MDGFTDNAAAAERTVPSSAMCFTTRKFSQFTAHPDIPVNKASFTRVYAFLQHGVAHIFEALIKKYLHYLLPKVTYSLSKREIKKHSNFTKFP